MSSSLGIHNTNSGISSRVHGLLIVLFGVVLLFASSQISIPLRPVPITFQTVGVMLIGITYSMRHGLQTIALYLTLGALGLPVYAGYNAGIGVLLGSTGGYLVGFMLAVYVMNKAKKLLNMQTVTGIFINCIIGTIMVFIVGAGWLSTLIGFEQAIMYGVVPFIMPGIVKSMLLTGCIKCVNVVK